jgi:predicted porin
MNADSNKHNNEDLNWYGIHAVYNQPEFLLAMQYISTEDANEAYAGDGYSVNGEYRVTDKWNVIGKYDYWEMEEDALEKERTLAGVSYEYNKNVEFILNYLGTDIGNDYSDDAIMLTAEVEW